MTPDLAARVQALAGLGLNRAVVAALADAFLPGVLSLDDRRYLAGPLVVHDSPWNDTRPRWLEDQVGAERVGIVFGLTPQFIVGPAEVAAVMYGASLDGPPDRDFADLYCWATVSADAARKRISAMERFEQIEMEPIRDEQVLRGQSSLHQFYSRLATDIRRRVVRAQADRERQKRATRPILDSNSTTCDSNNANKPNNKPIGVQIDFFD